MNRWLALTKVALKTNLFSGAAYKSKKNKNKNIFSIILVFAILGLSIAPLIVAGTRNLYDMLAMVNLQSYIPTYGNLAMAVILVIFSIMPIIEVFYYSNDIEYLLPLPLKPYEIVSSKFFVLLIEQYLIAAIIYFPMMITFGVMENASIFYYLLMVVMFFLVPIFPLLVILLILMVIMRFTNLGKYKDAMRLLFMLLLSCSGLIVNLIISRTTNMNAEGFDISTLQNMPIVRVINGLFYPVTMGVKGLLDPIGNLQHLLGFLIITLSTFLVFLVLAQLIYMSSIVGFNNIASKKEALNTKEIKNIGMNRNIFFVLIAREFKTILRTPAFLLNCLIMPILLPFIIILSVSFNDGDGSALALLGGLQETLSSPEVSALLTESFMAKAIGITFAIIFFLSGMNTIAMSSFSREGKTVFILKYLPIDRNQIIYAKLFIAIGYQLLVHLIMLTALMTVIHLPLNYILVIYGFVILITCFNSLLLFIFDFANPRLNWDNETQAVKGGLTQVILVLLNMAIAFVAGFVSFQFAETTTVVVSLGLLLPLIATVILLWVLNKTKDKYFERL